MTNISSFTFPSSITIIPQYCFYACFQLSNIEIPIDSNIEFIRRWCIALTLVSHFQIPSKVNNIEVAAFENTNLRSISVDRQNLDYRDENSLLINSKLKTVLYYPARKSGPVTIPEGIIEVSIASLSACQISGVSLPTTLKTINSYAFQSTLITEIDIPDSVTYIGKYAFCGCRLLKRVKLPSNIVELKDSTFLNTGLTSIDLPETLKTIGRECFMNCPNLKSVILPDNLTTLNGKVFDTSTILEFKDNSNFYINEYYIIMTKDNHTVSQYVGGNEAKEIPILSDVIEIKSGAFQGKSLLTKVIFGLNSKLQIIQSDAFADCVNMQFIELPTKLTAIYSKAFLNCKNLQSIVLSSCTILGSNAFQNCINLVSVYMEDSSLSIISEDIFAGCTSLTNIKLPRSLSSIGTRSFLGCTSLSSVLYHSDISSLGNDCFKQCNLELIDLSSCSRLTSISEYCFSDNANLVEIKLPDSIKIINSYSFSNTGIQTLTCPLYLETIYPESFFSCIYLSKIIIPSDCKLSSIGIGSFRNCFAIQSIICSNNNYKVVTGALFDVSMTSLILFPPASPVKYFSLPGSTINIGEGAFMSCINLITITIPSDSVQKISQNAFEGCHNLKHINIPICVLSVGKDAFKDCERLSCGCEIENRSEPFINELIKTSKLPRRCIYDCSVMCSIKILNSIQSNFLIHPFIVMIL